MKQSKQKTDRIRNKRTSDARRDRGEHRLACWVDRETAIRIKSVVAEYGCTIGDAVAWMARARTLGHIRCADVVTTPDLVDTRAALQHHNRRRSSTKNA